MSIMPSIFFPEKINFPKMLRVTRKLNAPALDNIEKTIRDEVRNVLSKISVKAGGKIAVAVGSRGIGDLPMIVGTVISELKEKGLNPFIVPAMGSHGGATAEGQREVLKHYGITEKNMDAPIRASMEVVKIGKTSKGIPVYFDKIAFESDGIIPINRIKKHTDFIGPIESGLCKMLAIGLGKEMGAINIHRVGPPNLAKIIPEIAQIIINETPILFGVAIVENSYHKIAKIKVILASDFITEETKLLEFANSLLPKVPVDTDLLIVDEMGKDISGGGMDPNVIGRVSINGDKESNKPKIFRVVVLDVTELSNGNVSGLGVADFTTKHLIDKIDFEVFYTNELVSGLTETGKIPMALATDRDAIAAGLNSCWMVSAEKARVIRIKNTMILDKFYISEALRNDIEKLSDIISIGTPRAMRFNKDGYICNGW